MRDRASYIQQARGIARRSLFVLGFNWLLCILLVAWGGMATPAGRNSSVLLWIGLGAALVVPVAKVWLDMRGKRVRDHGLYLGSAGTTLLWGPIYLVAMFGDRLNMLMDLAYVGAALLLGSVFWPTREAPE